MKYLIITLRDDETMTELSVAANSIINVKPQVLIVDYTSMKSLTIPAYD